MANGLLDRLRERQQSLILFTAFRRPYSRRDAVNRAFVFAAIIAAVVLPIFIGRGGGDATAGAGESYRAQLAELESLRLERDESGASDELDARIEQLEAETQLGYLKRDGDASDKGALAPDFRLLDLEGEPHRLSEIAGPIVLNFWASWCEPCIEEMPEFEIVSQEVAGRATFIGVNDGESPETAREFAYDVTGVQYLILLDPTKSMTDGPYPLVGRPTTFFIGADGIIKDLRVGLVKLDTLRDLVGELIGEDLSDQATQAAPTEYGEQALDLIASARANLATADAEVQRWRDNPELLADPAWQRNMTTQTRLWSDLTERMETLSPPEQWDELHRKVADALAQIANAAGPLIRDAIESENASGMETAISLYDSFRAIFDVAAENLAGVIETQ